MSDEDEQRATAPDLGGDTRPASQTGAPAVGDASAASPKPLGAAAKRALAEAEARRAAIEAQVAALPKELGGRGGREPGRYGDWEVKGLATDF
jgi:hypothetical protein